MTAAGKKKLIQNILGYKVKNCFKNDEDVSKGYRSQLEVAPIGQM